MVELLRKNPPPPSFDPALEGAIAKVVLEHGLIPGQSVGDDPADGLQPDPEFSAPVLLLINDQQSLSRVIVVSPEDRANFYTEYVGRGDMRCAIGKLYFGEPCLPNFKMRQFIAHLWRPVTKITNTRYLLDHLCLIAAKKVAPNIEDISVRIDIPTDFNMQTEMEYRGKALSEMRSCNWPRDYEMTTSSNDDTKDDTDTGTAGAPNPDKAPKGGNIGTAAPKRLFLRLDEQHVLLFKDKIPARAFMAAYAEFVQEAKMTYNGESGFGLVSPE